MEKIKHFIASNTGKDILTVLIVILVGLGSFGLGRLSKVSSQAGLKVSYEGEREEIGQISPNIDISPKTQNGAFFGSNKGSKYYSLGCAAGKTIKQENRVYFNTSDEAEAAGYTLSTSCK